MRELVPTSHLELLRPRQPAVNRCQMSHTDSYISPFSRILKRHSSIDRGYHAAQKHLLVEPSLFFGKLSSSLEVA